MIRSPNCTAVLDANVLYPAPLRDFLLNLADVYLFEPKWTEEIQEEWIKNLLLKRIDIKKDSLAKTKQAMDSAFPNANIIDYEGIIDTLSLPDQNDRHVLAAAISGNADVIVTFNLKHFPLSYLKSFGLEAQHPDSFILSLINYNKQASISAFKNLVKSLKNPPKSKMEVLQVLARCGLKNCLEKMQE